MADVLLYLVQMATALDVDLIETANVKVETNGEVSGGGGAGEQPQIPVVPPMEIASLLLTASSYPAGAMKRMDRNGRRRLAWSVSFP